MAATRATAKTTAAALAQATAQTLAVACVDAYLALKQLGETEIARSPALATFCAAVETAIGDHIK